MKAISIVTLAVLIVGGLNWGLIAAANVDLVAAIFGPGTMMTRVVYGLVGLSALVQIASLFNAFEDTSEPVRMPRIRP